MTHLPSISVLIALFLSSCGPSNCSVDLEVVVDGEPAAGRVTLRLVDGSNSIVMEMVDGKCAFIDVPPGEAQVDFKVESPHRKLIPPVALSLQGGVHMTRRVEVATAPLRIRVGYLEDSGDEWSVMIRGKQSWGPAFVPVGGELLVGLPAPGFYEILATRRDQYGKAVVEADAGEEEIVAEVVVPRRVPVLGRVVAKSDGQFAISFDGPSPIPSVTLTVVGGIGSFQFGAPDDGEYSAYLVSVGEGRRDFFGPIKFVWPQGALVLDFRTSASARVGRVEVK